MANTVEMNAQGVLTIGGVAFDALAAEFGTPLYIMDAGIIKQNMRDYKNVMDSMPSGGLVLYASKAFSAKEIYRIANAEGIGVDVVSGGELYTALSAGMPAERICFHGNNKSEEEILYAVESGVGRIVADGEEELSILEEMAQGRASFPKVLLRVKPGIEAHTHDFVKTGQEDSKFGVSLKNGDALRILSTDWEGFEIVGVHCHIGSQIFESKPFAAAAELLIELIRAVYDKTGRYLTELNLGGGYGIRYTEADTPRPISEAMHQTKEAVIEACKKYEVPVPFLLVEPGRSIVGDAGATLYTVGAIKNVPGIRKYVSVNGGMADNPRYIMYEAQYDAVLPLRPMETCSEKVTICGKCCESGDILIKDILLPPLRRGDLLAVLSTGAYNYSMSSNYNRLPRPSVVMVEEGKARLIVKRESYEDVARNDL